MAKQLYNGCYYCGEQDPIVLDWHHVNPNTKSFTIGHNIYQFSLDKIINEIKKCVTLCRNCHMKLHMGILKPPRIHSHLELIHRQLALLLTEPSQRRRQKVDLVAA